MSRLSEIQRTQLEAAYALIGALLTADDTEAAKAEGDGAQAGAQAAPGCEHPEDDRVDAARMGHPSDWHCRACGYSHCPEEGGR